MSNFGGNYTSQQDYNCFNHRNKLYRGAEEGGKLISEIFCIVHTACLRFSQEDGYRDNRQICINIGK